MQIPAHDSRHKHPAQLPWASSSPFPGCIPPAVSRPPAAAAPEPPKPNAHKWQVLLPATPFFQVVQFSAREAVVKC